MLYVLIFLNSSITVEQRCSFKFNFYLCRIKTALR
nr:MAG TPA: hypothetical protein [Caudoviricetes sp.]